VATHHAHHPNRGPIEHSLPLPLDDLLPGARVKDAYGVASRSTTSILDPFTHPQLWRRSRQGEDRAALKKVQPDPRNGLYHRNAVLTLDRAVPHQVSDHRQRDDPANEDQLFLGRQLDLTPRGAVWVCTLLRRAAARRHAG
jgi:hypothetical protein